MTAPCPLCGADATLAFRAKDYNRRVTRESFNYHRCRACDLIFLWPIPHDLHRYYTDRYHVIPSSLEQLTAGAGQERYKIRLVKRFVPSGRLLEVGPGNGGFANIAKQEGFEVEAIEMDPGCCRFLEEVVGIRVTNASDVPRALLSLAPFEVIALWHVIEHLPDPWATFAAAAEKLLPGGILVVAAPNPDSWQFRVMGRYWPHVDAPRHLELIPLNLLADRARACGLETALATTTDEGSLYWNRFGWEMALSNCFANRFAKIGMRMAGGAIGRIVSPIEGNEGRGSAYTVIFRKKTDK
jgi:2-polyprenyl-3-methyl-5-hydroxy-6-metoxy-1,4-benzoquinol methylase